MDYNYYFIRNDHEKQNSDLNLHRGKSIYQCSYKDYLICKLIDLRK